MVPVILPAVCADAAAASASARVAKVRIRRMAGSYSRTRTLDFGALDQLVPVHLAVGEADRVAERLRGVLHLGGADAEARLGRQAGCVPFDGEGRLQFLGLGRGL